MGTDQEPTRQRARRKRSHRSRRRRWIIQHRRQLLFLVGGIAAVGLAVGFIVAATLSPGTPTPTTEAPAPPALHSAGSAEASVTVLEFSDFQ